MIPTPISNRLPLLPSEAAPDIYKQWIAREIARAAEANIMHRDNVGAVIVMWGVCYLDSAQYKPKNSDWGVIWA